MIGAVFKTMWLRLWRDKGALVLAFVLPGFIFAVFAAIFSNASGGSLDLRVAMALQSDAPASVAFAKDLAASESLDIEYDKASTLVSVKDAVRLGQADVGVVVVGDLADPTQPAIDIILDPSRYVAATVVKGQIRQLLSEAQATPATALFSEKLAMDAEDQDGPSDQSVTYYIGATAILFLLFSAMQAASITIEERRNGLSDRLMVGPMGTLMMLVGKFIFLTFIGFIQAAIIVAVAGVFFKVPVIDHLAPLALAALGTAMLAAALSLLVAALCKTQAQMHTASTFVVLLASAVGGSMVPRFMMPDWLQSLSVATPNYWSIEAFYGILARGQSPTDLLVVWGVLFGGSAVCLILAAIVSHATMRS